MYNSCCKNPNSATCCNYMSRRIVNGGFSVLSSTLSPLIELKDTCTPTDIVKSAFIIFTFHLLFQQRICSERISREEDGFYCRFNWAYLIHRHLLRTSDSGPKRLIAPFSLITIIHFSSSFAYFHTYMAPSGFHETRQRRSSVFIHDQKSILSGLQK